MGKEARIEIERARTLIDAARRYRVLLDGTECASLTTGETATFDVEPGTHTVQIAIDWGRSPTMTVDVPAGETERLVCRPRRNLLTSLYYATFGRDRYVALSRR